MRGLIMALFAFDFPGHGNKPVGGRQRASLVSIKTAAKTTTKSV